MLCARVRAGAEEMNKVPAFIELTFWLKEKNSKQIQRKVSKYGLCQMVISAVKKDEAG